MSMRVDDPRAHTTMIDGRRRTVHNHSAAELVADGLHVLGGSLPSDGRISWLPPGAGSHTLVNSYLLLEEDGALLIDGGVPADRERLGRQLDAVLPATRPLSIFFTRFEPDCVANGAWLMGRHEIENVYGAGVSNPFDFFDDIAQRETIRAEHSAELIRVPAQGEVPVGRSRSVRLVAPSLRLLATSWAFDSRTGALFTSDTFGHVQLRSADDRRVLRSDDDDDTTVESVRRHLLTKFDWISGADPEPLRKDLQAIFEALDVLVIAPTHGCPIVGRAAVERHYRLMLAALEDPAPPRR
ncbi:hypothetical protein [Pseudonocardia sp.]|uniref:hypothetical protein n=1 Tax=Pseudonocardia sp. TaxID=60912 RepID=UPI003D14C10D